MKAVRYFGNKTVKIVNDMDKPIPKGDEVLLKIAAAGVCHSDLHVIDEGAFPLKEGESFTLGYENAGWVEAAGEDVQDYWCLWEIWIQWLPRRFLMRL